MKSTERLQHLIYLLQSGKRLKTKDLAEEFGVTKRTIYRDFNRLSDLNIPITHDPEEGYGIMNTAEITPIMFTEHELYTIIMGLSFVRSQVNNQLQEDAEKVSRKIKASLPEDMRVLMNKLEDKTVVDPFLQKNNNSQSGGNWYIITKGLTLQRPIRFTYTTKSGESKLRIADPILLVYYYDHWNMIGFCHDRNDIRNFILDNMHDISTTDETAKVNYESLPKDHDELIFRTEHPFLVTVRINNEFKDHFLKHLPSKTVNIEEQKETLIISFYFDNYSFINHWLLQYGDGLEIISPHDLIDLRKDTLLEMLNKVDVSRET